MNKRWTTLVNALLTAALLAGCSGGGQSSAPAPSGAKVTIRGSNTVGEELAPKLIAAYKSDHPAITFDLESKGTGYGFGNLLVGGCDIAAASREANSNELALAAERGIELSNIVIGTYSIAVVVNAANPVAELTRAQVRDIFTGKVKNWNEVGGADSPIHLLARDPDFRHLFGLPRNRHGKTALRPVRQDLHQLRRHPASRRPGPPPPSATSVLT